LNSQVIVCQPVNYARPLTNLASPRYTAAVKGNHSREEHTKPVSKGPDIAGAVRLRKKSRDLYSSGVVGTEDSIISASASGRCSEASFGGRTTRDVVLKTSVVFVGGVAGGVGGRRA